MRKLLLLLCLLTLSTNVRAYDFMVDGIRYNILSAEDKTVEVTYDHQTGAAYYGEYMGDIIVPSEVTFNNITFRVIQIGNYAFKNCGELNTLIVSEGITSIGHDAVGGSIMNSVKEVYLPNSVNTISEWALAGNWYLKTVHLPENIQSIPNYLFRLDKALETVKLPENIMEIPAGCFDSCEGLTSIDIPSKVHTVRYCSFMGCKKLASIIIPKNVKVIENSAFSGCSSLKEIHFYSSVIKCDDYAFNDCSSLKSIFVHDINASDANLVFSAGTYLLATLFVPKGTKSLYKNANGWENFSNIEEFDDGTKIYKLTYIVDGEEVKSMDVPYGAVIIPETEPTKEGYTFSGWSDIPETMPDHDVTITGTFTINKYKLVYMVDCEEYKSYEVEYGASITPESEPTKEGYTFSGWSEIPTTMPAKDVTVTGTFTINKYKLTYIVDGAEYKTYEVEYGAIITPEAEPTKEGYSFSGWSNIPTTMPANDVTVTGSFTKEAYKLTYIVDGEVYKTISYDYGAIITPETEPTKEGYTFSGWSEIPETMPGEDVTITGSFTINKYMLTYYVDGEVYESYEVEYGTIITPETEPTKEGYTFSGWSWIPETMPAKDVMIAGEFSINSYKLTYMIDNDVYKEVTYEYGATITPEQQPEGNYETFEWTDLPQTMPAHDVVVYASYTTGIVEILMASQYVVRIYSPNGKKLDKMQKGLNIVLFDDGTMKKIVIK